MTFEIINPASLGPPRGWNHGLLAPTGARVLFVAGQTGGDTSERLAELSFVEQFGNALERVLAVVAEAGGTPQSVGRLTIFVKDIEAYRSSLRALGETYRRLMGKHYPAMALVAVSALVDPAALVEIEATAVIQDTRA